MPEPPGRRNWVRQGLSALLGDGGGAMSSAPLETASCGVPLDLHVEARSLPGFARLAPPRVRQAALELEAPWVRTLGKLAMSVTCQGWRFPVPPDGQQLDRSPNESAGMPRPISPPAGLASRKRTRLRPPRDMVLLKERLLYLLQPPLESWFFGRSLRLPMAPFPYQMEGIAFLMPRLSALLADEMGLGKTMQAIIAMRLLFHGGLIRRALVVCPKPLVANWTRELRQWAEDLPLEVITGDADARRCAWLVSNCPVKIVNYEVLTRDALLLEQEPPQFDLVILDEAQRIKNRDAKTAQAARGLNRNRSWALTGTPIENRPDDLVNLFAFLNPSQVPPDTPPRRLTELTADCILRRRKEEVLQDLPPRIERDSWIELSPAQREAYGRAEKEGVVHLNELGETITVQHVFELIMRLKQICNFDPLTGDSAKLEQLETDLDEIAASGRKAIIFSQWVEPLELLAIRLQAFAPLLFHGRIPDRQRRQTLEVFRNDPTRQLLLMSYGAGSVGLNLQFANYVFLFDRWWNPAVEDQAINRAHRIGQKEPVFVTRFVTLGTIEERICEVLERKRRLFRDLIESSSPPSSLGLSEEEIFSLFDLEVRPRRLAA